MNKRDSHQKFIKPPITLSVGGLLPEKKLLFRRVFSGVNMCDRVVYDPVRHSESLDPGSRHCSMCRDRKQQGSVEIEVLSCRRRSMVLCTDLKVVLIVHM